MLRISKFYFGWGEPARKPQFLPEIIVCRNEREAQRIRRKVRGPEVRVVSPTMAQLLGPSVAKITVQPGVDLTCDVGGMGSLGDLLKSRQVAWGDRAIFIEL